MIYSLLKKNSANKHISIIACKSIFLKELLLIFLLSFGFLAVFARIGVDAHHDGLMLKSAVDVSRGSTLFRETFSQYGPLSTYIQAIFVKTFGEYLVVVKLSAALFYAFNASLLYLIWGHIISKRLLALSLFIWLAIAPFLSRPMLPWPNVYAMFFLLLSGLFLLISLDVNSRKSNALVWFLAGLASSLTFFSRQSLGIPLILVCVVIFFVSYAAIFFKRNSLLSLVSYLSAVGFSVLIYFFWLVISNSLNDWFIQTWEIPLTTQKLFGYDFTINSFFDSLVLIARGFRLSTLIWTLLPITNFTVLVYSIAKLLSVKRTLLDMKVFVLSTVSLASWTQYVPVADLQHWYWGSTPMIGLLIYALNQIQRAHLKIERQYLLLGLKSVTVLGIIAIIVSNVYVNISGSIKRVKDSYVTLDEPKVLRYMKLTREEAFSYHQKYELIAGYLDAHPEKYFINVGPDALYLLFTPRSVNFHPLFVYWGNLNEVFYPNYTRILLSYVLVNKPLILASNAIAIPDYKKLTDVKFVGAFGESELKIPED